MAKQRPTIAAEKVAAKILGNIGNKKGRNTSIGQAMREAGLSPAYADNPQLFTKTDGWKQLVERYLPDDLVMKVHLGLLSARRLDHMVFPTNIDNKLIKELLDSVGCTLRKIVEGEQAKHAYFWSPDNKARNEALDKAIKIKGRYAPIRIQHETDQYEEMDTEELIKRSHELEDELSQRRKLIEPVKKKSNDEAQRS